MDAVAAQVRSGQLSEGATVAEFEKRWARTIGTKYCVAFSSGTGALFSALLASRYLGMTSRGGGIITNPITYAGTVNAIILAGFVPLFVDVEPGAFGRLDSSKLCSAVAQTEFRGVRLTGILPVHLFGLPERIQEQVDLASNANVPLFEDAAQAHGTSINGRSVGSWGNAGAFSFYTGHTIQAGEMGAVTTNDLELAQVMRLIKSQGLEERSQRHGETWFSPTLIGFNLRPTELNAALALSQLGRLTWIVTQRRQNARHLTLSLKQWEDFLTLPDFPEEACPFAYPLVLKEPNKRAQIRRLIANEGIETRPMFPCLPTQAIAYEHLRDQYVGHLNNAELFADLGLYLPCHQYLSDEDLTQITRTVGRAIEVVSAAGST